MDDYGRLAGFPSLGGSTKEVPYNSETKPNEVEKETLAQRLDRIEKQQRSFEQHIVPRLDKIEQILEMISRYLGKI